MINQTIGIDPGKDGALVMLSRHRGHDFLKMPLKPDGSIDFVPIRDFLEKHLFRTDHVYLERSVAFKMGRTSAFNYGRGFSVLEVACELSGLPTTYIEPRKWTKVIHAGIKADLDPKVKSAMAVDRLYKSLKNDIPTNRNGKMHEGIVDALLIAGFGLRQSK